jgi:hypothetical protein
MNFDSFDNPKMLMSDSLRDVLPEETKLDLINDGFILVVLATSPRENSLVGCLLGIETKSDKVVKLDLKVSIEEAYNFIVNYFSEKIDKNLNGIIFSLGEKAYPHQPVIYRIKTVKIVDLDATNKMCVLAVDLFKVSDEEK